MWFFFYILCWSCMSSSKLFNIKNCHAIIALFDWDNGLAGKLSRYLHEKLHVICYCAFGV